MRAMRFFPDILTDSELRTARRLTVLAVGMASVDALGLASIMPVMAVIADPEAALSNKILYWIFQEAGFKDVQEFALVLAATAFCLLVVSFLIKFFGTYLQLSFSHAVEYRLSKDLLQAYLWQPYEWHLTKNSSDMSKNILSEVSIVVGHYLTPLIRIISQCCVILVFAITLVLIDPILAATIGAGFGLAYLSIYYGISGLIDKLGSERTEANSRRFQATSEAFGALRDIKLGRLEDFYLRVFSGPAKRFASAQAQSQIIAQTPRFLLELMAFGGLLVIIVSLMFMKATLSEILPLLGLYAVAGYRILPAAQQIYQGVAQLRFARPALNTLSADLASMLIQRQEAESKRPPSQRAHLKKIALRKISYTYPGATRPALTNISIDIPVGATIGLVGQTGSGKTTLVDVLAGLLEPTSGEVLLGGERPSSDNLQRWRENLGYIPQDIYLADDTVEANIALGLIATEIDRESLFEVARAASIHDYIMTKLPDGYGTVTGERGAKLSGGQQQRIGIARALYNRPKFLILDEATSALDTLTERQVMQAINILSDEVTIVIVAHRLSTVKNCDCIYLLEDGAIAASGTYDELLSSDSQFRELAS